MSLEKYLKESADILVSSANYSGMAQVEHSINAIVDTLKSGKPLLVCGNGGSASDAMHIAGELVGRFLKEREALNCICLSSNPAVLTAWSNDYDFETVFSRQVEAYGSAGGAILGISTSGNSKNVINAFDAAHSAGMKTIGLTGESGGGMAGVSDYLIDVPSKSTPLIQQVHICIYHYICEQVEARIFND